MILNAPREEVAPLSGLQLLGDVHKLANANKPCMVIDDVGAMVRTRTKNVDNILDGDGMSVQPNPCSRLEIFGLSHLKCDIEAAGAPILRNANNFNPLLKSPFH